MTVVKSPPKENSQRENARRKEFLGAPFDLVDQDGAVERCLGWCRGDRESHLLVTLNAAILVMMDRDPELREACLAGDLIVPDGVPVVWASRLAGRGLAARVAGVDLMDRLLREADAHRLRIYFLGAKEHVISRLVELVRERHPGAEIAGYRNGYFSEADHEEIIRDIRASDADILFVGMPTPFKEVWCYRHREALNTPVIFGVGGSFDVIAGFTRRAPRWLQAIGLEWLWRLLMEPRRMWKRYCVTNTLFLTKFARAFVRHRILRKG